MSASDDAFSSGAMSTAEECFTTKLSVPGSDARFRGGSSDSEDVAVTPTASWSTAFLSKKVNTAGSSLTPKVTPSTMSKKMQEVANAGLKVGRNKRTSDVSISDNILEGIIGDLRSEGRPATTSGNVRRSSMGEAGELLSTSRSWAPGCRSNPLSLVTAAAVGALQQQERSVGHDDAEMLDGTALKAEVAQCRGRSDDDPPQISAEPSSRIELSSGESFQSEDAPPHRASSMPARGASFVAAKEKVQAIREAVANSEVAIFMEEGGPMTFPVIRFLSPLGVWLDRFRMLVALWTVVVTPLHLAFRAQYTALDTSPLFQGLAVGADVSWTCAVLLAMVTSVGQKSVGHEFLRYRLILWKRLTSVCFWCDALSAVPFLVAAAALEVPIPTSPGLRQLQLLKLLRVHWLFLTPASHFETQFWSKLQIIRMFLWVALCTHLTACLWYSVATECGTVDRHMELLSTLSVHSHYLMSFKYGVYMITGKPTTAHADGELVIIALTSWVGGIFFAFIYGNTTMLLTRMNINLSKHHEHIAIISSTIGNLNITRELKARIIKYHHFLALHHNVNAYKLLLQSLSKTLFVELKAHLFKKFFAKAPFFVSAPGGFVRSILQVMTEVTHSPGDMIVRIGDLGSEMYFIIKGKVDVLSSVGEVIGKLCENQYFGEIALLVSTPRLVSIRAATFCLLALITREVFMPILEEYPEQKRAMLSSMKNYPPVAEMLAKGQQATDNKTDSDEQSGVSEEYCIGNVTADLMNSSSEPFRNGEEFLLPGALTATGKDKRVSSKSSMSSSRSTHEIGRQPLSVVPTSAGERPNRKSDDSTGSKKSRLSARDSHAKHIVSDVGGGDAGGDKGRRHEVDGSQSPPCSFGAGRPFRPAGQPSLPSCKSKATSPAGDAPCKQRASWFNLLPRAHRSVAPAYQSGTFASEAAASDPDTACAAALAAAAAIVASSDKSVRGREASNRHPGIHSAPGASLDDGSSKPATHRRHARKRHVSHNTVLSEGPKRTSEQNLPRASLPAVRVSPESREELLAQALRPPRALRPLQALSPLQAGSKDTSVGHDSFLDCLEERLALRLQQHLEPSIEALGAQLRAVQESLALLGASSYCVGPSFPQAPAQPVPAQPSSPSRNCAAPPCCEEVEREPTFEVVFAVAAAAAAAAGETSPSNHGGGSRGDHVADSVEFPSLASEGIASDVDSTPRNKGKRSRRRQARSVTDCGAPPASRSSALRLREPHVDGTRSVGAGVEHVAGTPCAATGNDLSGELVFPGSCFGRGVSADAAIELR